MLRHRVTGYHDSHSLGYLFKLKKLCFHWNKYKNSSKIGFYGNINCYEEIYVFLFQFRHFNVECCIGQLSQIYFSHPQASKPFYRNTENWSPCNMYEYCSVLKIKLFKDSRYFNTRFDLWKNFIQFLWIQLGRKQSYYSIIGRPKGVCLKLSVFKNIKCCC